MASYHACGAWRGKDSTGDGLLGLYHPDGALRLTFEAGLGIYDPSGALRVSDASLETDPVGIYNPSGGWNITLVDGLTNVGITARNGSRNFVLEV